MLHIQRFTFNPFEENTYVLFDDSGECVIVDPGCNDDEEKEELENFITSNNLRVTKLLNTHCHVDHVLGNYFVQQRWKVKFYAHEAELPVLRAVKSYAPNFGFFEYQEILPDEYLKEGNSVFVGKEELRVLFVPGHAPGHVAFYHEASKSVVAGDVLFHNSIGRTDMPGGDHDTLIESIHSKLFTLPNDVTVFPGHGTSTTIGFEKDTNPFCAITKTNS